MKNHVKDACLFTLLGMAICLSSCSKKEQDFINPQADTASQQITPNQEVQARMASYQKIMGPTVLVKFVPGQRNAFAEDFKSEADVQNYLVHLRDYMAGKPQSESIIQIYLESLRPEVKSRVEAGIKTSSLLKNATINNLIPESQTNDITLPVIEITGEAQTTGYYPMGGGGSIYSNGTTTPTGGSTYNTGGGGSGSGSGGGSGGSIPNPPATDPDVPTAVPGVKGYVSFVVHDNTHGLNIPIHVTVFYDNGNVTNVNIRTEGLSVVSSNLVGGNYAYNSHTGAIGFDIIYYYTATNGNISMNFQNQHISGAFNPEPGIKTEVDASVH